MTDKKKGKTSPRKLRKGMKKFKNSSKKSGGRYAKKLARDGPEKGGTKDRS